MSDVLVTTETQEVVAPEPKWTDSAGLDFQVGDRVHVETSLAEDSFDYETYARIKGRAFDFGGVESLNENGTVTVFWDAAGCGCNSDAVGREEKASDLTIADQQTEVVYDLAYTSGYADGIKSSQSRLRDILGLEDQD